MADLKVGFAGLTHGHVWGLLDTFGKHPDARLVAVSDPTPLLENGKSRFERAYTDWRQMLERESLDALVLTSDNRESAEIATEALKAGIPCMVEKPMAATTEQALALLDAAETSGKTLMVNWPFAWWPWIHELKRRVDAGEVGHVFHARFRIGHFGPKEIGCDEYFVGWLYDEAKNGGGAIADFGGYGAVLARWLFGMPSRVIGVRENTTKVEDVPDDHALILMRYPRCTFLAEATWATKGSDGGPNTVVHGKDGTLYASDTLYRDGEMLEVPALPLGDPASYFFHCIRTGQEPEGMLNATLSFDAVRIVEAAKESSSSGCDVVFDG